MSHQMGLGISILIGQCTESKQTTYTPPASPSRPATKSIATRLNTATQHDNELMSWTVPQLPDFKAVHILVTRRHTSMGSYSSPRNAHLH